MKKRILSFLMAICLCTALLGAFTSCGDDGKYSVGILQLAPHPALDAATDGFKQALIDELGEENVTFDYQNAQGDSSVCGTIAAAIVAKNPDLIMANATAALQAVANSTATIPILGTSITDYASALDLENYNGTVGGNISGTSDLAPLDEQAAMFDELLPDATNIGILFCSAEPNSYYQAEVIKDALEGAGKTVEFYTFSDSNDIASVVAAACAASDALYIPTDNTAANNAAAIYSAMGNNKKPLIAGESGICTGCGIATLSIDYYDLGYATGLMAAKILKGEKNISEMPIEFAPAPTKKYNATICGELGITAPAGYTVLPGTEVAE